MKGEEIDMEFPTLAQRIYAANSVAPYLHAKLVSVEQKTEIQVDNVISAKPLTASEWARKYTGQTIEINPVQAVIDAEAIAVAKGDEDPEDDY
jgi:D-serine deaminase-like pyridoxal phosphate-dependent protein